jgi:hypothetical protein
MGGGLLQLVAYGAQDAYICGNPQITFWKGLYKRHTNFAMEPFRINFTGQPNWGTKQSAIIGRHADLLYSTYIEVVLPYNDNEGGVAYWNGGGGYAGRLGYNLIKYVELDIGGQVIDRLYGEWLFLWDTLTMDTDARSKLSNMVGLGVGSGQVSLSNPASCGIGGRPAVPNTAYIPLFFFFTKNPGAALPLIALQYHEVKINIQWNDVKTLAGSFTSNYIAKHPNPTQAAIYIDYIYLDVEERRRMAQQSHEYLIEQTQFNEDKGITSGNTRIDLTFNHPVKELVWVVQPEKYTNCSLALQADGGAFILQPFNYSAAAVYEQFLQINGQDRMDRRYGDYFSKVQPYQHHSGATQPGIYMYSFALRPEEHQPSGTCNFSRIDTATIVMNMSGGVTVDDDTNSWNVRVYAVNYNILRIMSGMAGLAYSN